MADLSKTAAWAALTAHAEDLAPRDIRDLFEEDPGRLEWGLAEAAGLTLDITKNRLTRETLRHLTDLAKERDLAGWQRRMATGEPVNASEGRAALHMALRGSLDPAPKVGGLDTGKAVSEAKPRFLAFAEAVRAGQETAAGGKPFQRVIHIGIGGSDLGPRLAVDALSPFTDGTPEIRFVANVDATELTRGLAGADPETTLIIVASKTFTTQETMTNARTARAWLEETLPPGANVANHFVAATANQDEARTFGVTEERIFPFWDWVGGRFSVWSSVGLCLAIAIGRDGFEEFLAGAAEMDHHFLNAAWDQNLPVLLALVGLWNRNFLELLSHAVLPYDHSLALLPGYLQQLEMESNGKSAQRDGAPVSAATAPAVWGAAGTTGQHAFYQWLHQGTDVASSDIVLPLVGHHGHPDHHNILVAHAIAQAEALAFGRDERTTREALGAEGLGEKQIDRLLPHRTFPGNRPVSVLTMEHLTPRTLGALLALYEHKVFTQGILWNINSFDQWGVELGKTLAGRVLSAVEGEGTPKGFDPSTRRLIEAARAARASKPTKT